MENGGKMRDSFWPEADDVIFREGFHAATTAELGWFGMGTQTAYADGFMAAADQLIENIEQGLLNRHPDEIFYAIAFLYRHSVETRLKQIIAAASYHLAGSADIRMGHDLSGLWHRARKLLTEAREDAKGMPLERAGKLILEFHRLDRRSTALRMPLPPRGNTMNWRGFRETSTSSIYGTS